MQIESSNNITSPLEVSNSENNKLMFMKKRYKNLKIKNLLIVVGDRNKIQIRMLIIFVLIGFFQSFFLNSLAYLFYVPVYKCIDSSGNETLCTKEQACSQEYSYELISSIYSLNMKFDLVCENEYKAILGPIFILVISGLVSCVVFPMVDFIGRKKTFILTTILHTLGLIISILLPSYYMIILGLTIAFTGHYIWFANCYIYMNETMGGYIRVISVPCLCTISSIGMIFTHWISEYVYRYDLFLLFNLIGISLTVFFYFLFIDSPFYLYKFSTLGIFYNCLKDILCLNFSGKKQEQRLHLLKSILFNPSTDIDDKHTKINAQNENEDLVSKPVDLDSISLDSLKLDDISLKNDGEFDKNKKDELYTDSVLSPDIYHLRFTDLTPDYKLFSNSNSYCDLFTIKNGLPFLGIIMLSLPLFIGDALTLYSIQNMGINSVQFAGILMGFFELIGNMLSFMYSPLFARKQTNIICQIIMFLAVVCLIIINLNYNYIQETLEIPLTFEISQGIFCLFVRLAISFNTSTIFTYNMELFPTHLRAISLSIILLIERFFFGFSGYIINETLSLNFHPLCSLIIFCVITVPLAYSMPNTDHKGIPN